jgi:predicted nucleic-acid-binding protein
MARGLHLNTQAEETMMRTSAAALRIQTLHEAGTGAVVETTLLELVTTLGELTEDDREVVTTVVELLRSGRVRLIGNFRGQKIALA